MYKSYCFFKKWIPLFLFLLFIPANAKTLKPGMQMDFAQFQAGKDWEYLEVYYSIERKQLGYQANNSQYEARYTFHVQILQEDSIFKQQSWQRLDRVTQLSEIKKGQFVYDQAAFFLKPGSFFIKTLLINQQKDTLLSNKQPIQIYKMSKSQLNMSDIELAVEVKPDTSKHIFNKNNFSVIPNASGLYGAQLPKVLFYCEIYQLSPLTEDTDSTYSMTVGVFNKNNMLVKTIPNRIRKRVSHSVVEYGDINISDLPTGTYILKVIIKDHAVESEIFKTKQFEVYNQRAFTQSRVKYDGKLIRIKAK